jgi:hypothetical protein
VWPPALVTASSRRSRPTAINSGATAVATAVASTSASTAPITGATTATTTSTTTSTLLMVPMPAKLCAFAASLYQWPYAVATDARHAQRDSPFRWAATEYRIARRPGTGLRGNPTLKLRSRHSLQLLRPIIWVRSVAQRRRPPPMSDAMVETAE